MSLKQGNLNKNSSRKPVATIAELRIRVQGFIREEQSDEIKKNRPNAVVARQQQQFDLKKGIVGDQRPKQAVENSDSGYNNMNRYDNRSNFRNRVQPYRNRGYEHSMTWTRNQQDRVVPLAVTLTEALHTCLEANLIRFPKELKRPHGNVDRSKWCEYHRIYGHNTDDCFTLRKETEALIKASCMKQLAARRDSNDAGTSTNRDDDGKEIDDVEPKKQSGRENKGTNPFHFLGILRRRSD